LHVVLANLQLCATARLFSPRVMPVPRQNDGGAVGLPGEDKAREPVRQGRARCEPRAGRVSDRPLSTPLDSPPPTRLLPRQERRMPRLSQRRRQADDPGRL